MTAAAKLALVLLAALSPLAQSPKKLHKLEEKLVKLEKNFHKQKDAVHRAKALAKLLPREVEMASYEAHNGRRSQAIARLERYGRLVVRIHQELLDTGRNPVKHSSGFRELQISLRESVRRLRDLIFNLPLEGRQPFVAVRQDLTHLNNQLLRELFPPRQPPKKKKKHHLFLQGGRP